jgi:predicted esterase
MHESAPLVDPDDAPRSVTVLLHAMCADSTWMCDWLQYFAMQPQWQICPRAPRRCRGEGFQWGSAAESRRTIEAAVAALEERQGARVRDDAVVLAGFSQGAYALADLVRDLARRPWGLRVRCILAQGARVRFSGPDLRTLGVRLVLTAGDRDSAAPAMRAEAERLRREGADARYASLGKDEGHFISVSTGKIVAALIDECR